MPAAQRVFMRLTVCSPTSPCHAQRQSGITIVHVALTRRGTVMRRYRQTTIGALTWRNREGAHVA